MQQGELSEKRNLSVDAWISYLNGKCADNKLNSSVQSEVPQKEAPKNTQDERFDECRRNSKLNNPERARSRRIKSASGLKRSEEAEKALLDMGVATDDTGGNTGDTEPNLEKSRNFQSQLLPINGALQTSFLATSQDKLSSVFEEDTPFFKNTALENHDLSVSLNTENESKQKVDERITFQSEETYRTEKKPLLSDRDRIYNPLEISYRSELRKITSRMGVELDAIQAFQCNHHKKSSKQSFTPSARSQSKSRLQRSNHEVYTNLPSCTKCRQQYFSYCLQNSKHQTVKRIPLDHGTKNLGQQKNVLAFNTSAPRKSFIDINGVGNANSDRSSPMRAKSVSPMHHISSKKRQTSGSHNIVRERRTFDKTTNFRGTGSQMNSATPVPTKLVEPVVDSNVERQTTTTQLNNAKNRTIVIPKTPLANSTNTPLNKRRSSTSKLNDSTKQQNGNASNASNRSNPLSSQKLEKSSAKVKEIERLKSKTDSAKNGIKTETKKRVVESGFYDSRFEGDWQRPWDPKGSITRSDEEHELIDESQKQMRDQSITKCKEWLALWFSNQ